MTRTELFGLASAAVVSMVAAAFVLVLVGHVFGKTDQMASTWTPAMIQIDGKTDDWKGISPTFFPDQRASLALANDQRFLYFLFRTDDPRWARLIKVTGLTLYVDPQGKKKKDFYVTFKGGPSRETLRAFHGREADSVRRPDRFPPEGQPEITLDRAPSLICFEKGRIVEKEIPLDGAEGPAAAFDTTQGFFVYEFRVPLNADTVRYYGVDTKPGQPIMVGLVWGDRPKTEEGRGGGFHGGFGGEPGGMGGGMGVPGGRGGMGERGGIGRQMPGKQELWLKSQLAESSAAGR